MRYLYSGLFYLLTPLILCRLLWRALHARAYWQRWGERMGFGPTNIATGSLWIHAVSVGEVQASVPLIKALQKQFPQQKILLTTMTPTGSQRVKPLFGNTVDHCYLPYDWPSAVQRFLRRTKPSVGIIMETELWPNLFYYTHQAQIPLILANARLSQRSAKRYHWILPLIQQTLGSLTAIAAQSQVDADRLIDLGASASHMHITNSIKFELNTSASTVEEAQVLRRSWGENRAVWIAASTHEGEDEVILDAFRRVRAELPDCLLLLVPRHPERFGKVANLCRKQGWQTVLRSEGHLCTSQCDLFVGDTLGELMRFYAAADVALVGGSLVPTGGHNPLEPAALGLPVLFGPHMFNFQEISQMLLDQGAAYQVEASNLDQQVLHLLQNPNLRSEIGEQGLRLVKENRGALASLVNLIAAQLPNG